MRTADRLTRLEDAVWQLVILAGDGQDPRTAPTTPISTVAR